MDPNKLEHSLLLSHNLSDPRDWKYTYLTNRPLPQVEFKQTQDPLTCFKSVAGSLIGGFFMGVALTMFMSINDNYNPNVKSSLKTQAIVSWNNFKVKAYRQGRGFSLFGAILFGFECPLQKLRGSHDAINSLISGGLTGMVLAINRKSSIKGILRSTVSTSLFIGAIAFFLES